MRPSFLLVGACLMLTSAGCSRSQERAVRAQAGSAAVDPLSQAKQLALAAASGNTAVDRELLKLERAAKARPERAELWESLGQLWLRKARESSDPGYYLHADASAELALSLVPEQRGATNLRALCLLEQHRFEAARELAEKVLAREPDEPTELGIVSDAELALGQPSWCGACCRSSPTCPHTAELRTSPGSTAISRRRSRMSGWPSTQAARLPIGSRARGASCKRRSCFGRVATWPEPLRASSRRWP
jgi:tetratricopeptide (TPR) repeat protein